MSTTTTSGRKQLSDQLDRFDMILDGLSDGLNDAIADAARAGAHAAVQEILTGLLNDPQVRAAMHPPTPDSGTHAATWYAAEENEAIVMVTTSTSRNSRGERRCHSGAKS